MDKFGGLCRNMASDSNIMTFSDITVAAANGAAAGAKHTKSVEGVVIGAIAGVSLEASKRVVKISKDLIEQKVANNNNKPRSR